MSKPQSTLKSWSGRQAIAILAVDNIKVSEFGYDMLKRSEEGTISYKQAKEAILAKAKAKVCIDGVEGDSLPMKRLIKLNLSVAPTEAFDEEKAQVMQRKAVLRELYLTPRKIVKNEP